MHKEEYLCFEIHIKDGSCESLQINRHVFTYKILFEFLAQVCNGFTFSLRHLYSPLNNQKLRTFILINPGSRKHDKETLEKIKGLVTKGCLRQFYNFTYREEGFPLLNWVGSIGEIIKFGEFIEQSDFTGYLPHHFSTELNADNFSILDLLEGAGYEELVLEFSLETYNLLNEQKLWKDAINDLVNCLSRVSTRSHTCEQALKVYKQYQDTYFEDKLFNYSIKSLSKNSGDTFAILQMLIEIVSKKTHCQKVNPIFTLNHSDNFFSASLEATQNVRVLQGIEWNGWKKVVGKNLEKKLIKETVKSGGLLSSLDDFSLIFPILPSNLEQLNQSQKINHALPASNESTLDPNSSDLALGGDTSLSRIFEVQIPKVEHLKPLHHITTFQEVVGFFQVFSPTVSVQQNNFLALSAEEIFTKYRHLITKDTYIVGLDDNENPIISSWAEIPHRLIAGLPGAGKTNFLNWIVFQFLYVNPKRRVYIADFGGVDFQHLNKLKLNVEIVDAPEDCPELIEKIHHEEYERRLDLMKEYSVSDLKLLQREGVDIDRTLWIIDEAADIADVSSKLRDSIEKRLKEYARKGRKYGIHVLYCTQRPTTEVVTKQVTDQCEEKTVFRVTPDASQRILDDTIAGNIPKDARGRAWLDGYAGRMFVNVPKMEKPEGSTIPIADTLWRYLSK